MSLSWGYVGGFGLMLCLDLLFFRRAACMGPLMIVGDSMETAGAFLRAFRGVIVLKDPPSTPNKQLSKIRR